MTTFRRFWLDNGSVSILQMKKGYARLVSLNETWHLNGRKG